MTTLTIAAVDTAGHPLAHRTVEVAVIAGRPGGHPAAGGPVIAAPVQVRLDEDGTGEVDVDPTDTLDAPGAFVRCTVLGSSPTIVRSLTIPTGPSTVDWADPDLQVADPVIPEVGITRHQLDDALAGLGPGEAPTAVFAVSTLDMSGGSWTELPGIGLPRMFLVGQPVLVLSGADRGLWTVTASGPCTPLPDPGGAVIAVTAQQAVASPIVDETGQPAGWVLGPSAETVTALGLTVASLGSDPRLSDARTPTAHAASHGAGGSDPITIDTAGLVPATRTLAGLNLTTDRTAPALRSALGVVPGVDVQPADSDLTAIAALATTAWGRALLTLADAATARTVLDAAATGHVHDASAITTGVVAAARLGSGTASAGTMLTGAGTWAPRGYKLIAGQPYDGGAIKSGTAVTTRDRVAWTTLEDIALGAQVDALWVDVTTGGSTGATVQLSLLADDGWGRPGALLAQTAQLPAETSTAIVMGTFGAVTLTTSTIHIGVHVRSTAQPTLRAISSRATCIPSGGASTSNTMAWSSTIAGVAVGSNPAVDVSSAACYRAGIRGA